MVFMLQATTHLEWTDDIHVKKNQKMFSYNELPLLWEHSFSQEEKKKKITIPAVCNVFLKPALFAKGKYLSLAFV